MSTVWKYDLRLDDEQVLEIPAGAEFLHVAEQHGKLNLWARVIPRQKIERRLILIRGTGAPIGSQTHIGTVVTAGGNLVWHVFDGGVAA